MVDATALTTTNFNVVGDVGSPFPASAVATLTRIPGTKTFQESNGGNFFFTVQLDGTVNFDPSLDGFLGGRGTSTLVVNGFQFTVDATALTSANFNVVGDVGNPFPTNLVGALTRIPGTKTFQNGSGGNFLFTVGLDGKLDYDSSLDTFVSGRGTTTLVVNDLD